MSFFRNETTLIQEKDKGLDRNLIETFPFNMAL